MTDTNNTDGAALLPVTPSDREAAARLVGEAGCCACLTVAAEAFARHRISHSLPGDVGTVALQNCIGSILKVIEPLLRFHETGGHEGDGSGKQLAKIRAVLRTPIGKLPAALAHPAQATPSALSGDAP